MIQVTQSPFLQALGYAIINSLWQFAMLWLAYFLINSFFKLSSHKKYSLSLLMQITGFIWFAGTLVFYYQQCLNETSTTAEYFNQYSLIEISTSALSTKAKLFAWIIKTEQLLPYLSIAYLLLLVFLSGKWLHCYRFTQRIKQEGISKINVDWKLFVQRLSEQLGIRTNVKIFLSDKVKAPLTIGFLKPVILIPLASINHLNTEQMEAVILHELAHIKRFDYLMNLLLSLIEATLFFNPFMQLLSRHIKRERENSCDDWVLQYEYNPATYAKALLKIATLQTYQRSFAMSAAENKNALLIRVKRMIEKSEKSFHYRHQLIALLFITTILSTIAWLSPENNRATATRMNKFTPNIPPLPPGIHLPQDNTESLVAKVDNPLFNPLFFLSDKNEEVKLEMEKKVKHIEKHVQKMMISKSLPLAIPKNRKLDLRAIPAPVIKNPSSYTKNRMEISPRLIFNIDTLKFRGHVKKLFATKWMADLEKVETGVRKNFALVFERSEKSDQPYDKEKLMHDMQIVLSQIKATKLKLQKSIPSPTYKVARSSNLTLQTLATTQAKRFQQEEELKTLAEEIRKQWQEVQQQYVYLTRIDENMRFSIQLPAVVYTAPKAHSYSYEFTEKPRVRVAGSAPALNTTNPCAEVQKKVNSTEDLYPVEELQKEVIIGCPSAQEQPVKKVTRTKKLTIIHI